MEPHFLNQFLPADKVAWRAQVQKDLKDPLAPDNLRWQTAEGFTLEPYYTSEDLATIPVTTIQAAQKQIPGWLNVPAIVVEDEKTTNSHLLNLLTRGVDGFILDLTKRSVESIEWSKLLHKLKLSDTPVWFRVNGGSSNVARALTNLMPYQLKGGILDDPITQHLGTAALGEAIAKSQLGEAVRLTETSPQFRTICASSTIFHNAGATATQELAFLLGSLADQYDRLTDAGLLIEQLIPKTVLSLSVGTSYFVEIAKGRALRVLWQGFLSAYPVSPALAVSPFILAQTSTFYDAALSPYTNLLRATTEAMAAAMGGCDVLTVHPYNAVLEQSTTAEHDEFSDRIARNLSVLLTEESYLDKVADPSAGSYYIETLTHKLVEAAWALFLQVEAMGGLLKATETGFVQAQLEQAYHAKVESVQNGKVLVGVTKFQEKEEIPAKSIRSERRDTGLLPERRLAGEFEH